MRPYKQGFTIVELLVTIGVIGILSAIVVVNYQGIRTKARIASAQKDLFALRDAVLILAKDTNKWPNGCEVGLVTKAPISGDSNEVALNTQRAGLLCGNETNQPPCPYQPTVGSGSPTPADNCTWTQQAVDHWDGPYIVPNANDPWGQYIEFLDPWGNPYWFDTDYNPYADCPGHPQNRSNPGYYEDKFAIAALVSGGPNEQNGAQTAVYDCDDVFVQI